jgi:hypothetical protein
MPTVTDSDLISEASAVLNPRRLSPTVMVGTVGCALITTSGTVHVGVCMDVACGIGFCAEHAAVASMVTHGESRIHTIVAVGPDEKCCRHAADAGNLSFRSTLRTPTPESCCLGAKS